MEVIVFEKDTYYKMISEMKKEMKEAVKEAKLEALKLAKKDDRESQWVSKKDAMAVLMIKSSVTLQKLRDTMQITFSQAENSKTIIYKKQSLFDYINSNIVTM